MRILSRVHWQRKLWVLAFLSFAGISPSDARDCIGLLRLKALIDTPRTGHKKSTLLDAAKVKDEAEAARVQAASEGLRPPKGDFIRTKEQITAWIANFSNRMHDVRHRVNEANRAGETAEKMSVDEFFGMVDGGFGRGKQFSAILAKYNIRNIRFVNGKKFKAKARKDGDEFEVILDVPRVNFDDPVQGALWIKNFTVALHDAAQQQMVARLEAAKPRDLRNLWEKGDEDEDVKAMRTDSVALDRETGIVLRELDNYLVQMTPTLSLAEHNELVGLPQLNYKLSPAAHKTYAWGTELISTFGVGPTVEIFNYITKRPHPLADWKPTRLFLEGREGLLQERKQLTQRLNLYFSERRRKQIRNWAMTGFAVATSAVVLTKTLNTGGKNAQAGAKLQAESDKTAELDALIKKSEAASGKKDLIAVIGPLEAQFDKAMKWDSKGQPEAVVRAHEELAIKIHDELQSLYSRLAALDPDGITPASKLDPDGNKIPGMP